MDPYPYPPPHPQQLPPPQQPHHPPPPAYYPYPPPQPQIVTKPGGLSGAAHAVHILITLMTCLAWLPFYIVFMFAAPARRYEVIVPIGADPAAVQAAYAATRPTKAERHARNRSLLVVALFLVGLAAVCGVVTLITGR